MTTQELYDELLREIEAIADDEDLLRQAINFIQALRQGKHPDLPCCYTVEEMKERVAQTLDDALHGRGISEEEVMRRTERWK